MSSKASRKRKHGNRYPHTDQKDRNEDSKESKALDYVLHIQAYEAEIVRGSQVMTLAESLEGSPLGFDKEAEEDGSNKRMFGSALLKWRAGENEEDGLEKSVILVDRYDARLLLDALPPSAPLGSSARPTSPGGWSDIPSDSEDTFFLSPTEIEDFHREKRRRMMERFQEERVKARMAEDGDAGASHEAESQWGGSDEEADEAQTELIRRTAAHIISSPNPAQLEMRILANYGADKRFAFLKGRWKRVWQLAKAKARLGKSVDDVTTGNSAQKLEAGGLGGLTAYGSGESDED